MTARLLLLASVTACGDRDAAPRQPPEPAAVIRADVDARLPAPSSLPPVSRPPVSLTITGVDARVLPPSVDEGGAELAPHVVAAVLSELHAARDLVVTVDPGGSGTRLEASYGIDLVDRRDGTPFVQALTMIFVRHAPRVACPVLGRGRGAAVTRVDAVAASAAEAARDLIEVERICSGSEEAVLAALRGDDLAHLDAAYWSVVHHQLRSAVPLLRMQADVEDGPLGFAKRTRAEKALSELR